MSELLREALERIQWGACDGYTAVCPHCEHKEADGHAEDCFVGKALAASSTDSWTCPSCGKVNFAGHPDDGCIHCGKAASSLGAQPDAIAMVRRLYDHFQGPHACGDFTCNCGNCGLCDFRKEVEAWLAADAALRGSGEAPQDILAVIKAWREKRGGPWLESDPIELFCLLNEIENEGFEMAHALRDCGHSRGDYRDANYIPGEPATYTASEKCIGCEREAKLAAASGQAGAAPVRFTEDSRWRGGWRWACKHGNESSLHYTKLECGCELVTLAPGAAPGSGSVAVARQDIIDETGNHPRFSDPRSHAPAPAETSVEASEPTNSDCAPKLYSQAEMDAALQAERRKIARFAANWCDENVPLQCVGTEMEKAILAGQPAQPQVSGSTKEEKDAGPYLD